MNTRDLLQNCETLGSTGLWIARAAQEEKSERHAGPGLLKAWKIRLGQLDPILRTVTESSPWGCVLVQATVKYRTFTEGGMAGRRHFLQEAIRDKDLK